MKGPKIPLTRREFAEATARETFPKDTETRSLFARLLDRELAKAGYNPAGQKG